LNSCPFCNLPHTRIQTETPHALVVEDGFPVSDGHTLVIPRRHVISLYELASEEQEAVWHVVAGIRADLITRLKPDGFNIGINDGLAAGQTIMHAHIHVIPRRCGDVADPRGGVRWVIPERAAYWKK
jgi:diadenosine tetraphosphate (Ap4A) HIT family hydrolase